jgi:hypothetical protein
MSDNNNLVGAAHFNLDNVIYSIGLRGDPNGGLRGTWRCPHCSLVVPTTRALDSRRAAIELAKEEVKKHHEQMHL